MGAAKDLLAWHGKSQRYFMADLLHLICDDVFVSCRQDQLPTFDRDYQALADTFLNMGPFGGILSALHAQRDKAWLSVACDLPLLGIDSLRFLMDNRRPEKMATTYKNPVDGLPEPLVTIWEPKSYPILLSALNTGSTSLRQVLMNHDTCLLSPPYPDALKNINTPEEAIQAEAIIRANAATLTRPDE